MRLSFIGSSCLTTVLLASRSIPVAAADRVPTHVACVGDSITSGVGASDANTKSYPADLQSMLGSGVQVKNFGHSGATMLSVGDLPYQNQSEYTAATTFVSNAGANAVVDVIIMLGTNDSKPYNWTVNNTTRADQFKKDCAAMVDHFAQLATHPTVYLALPPHAYDNAYQISGAVIHDEIIPVIQQVATEKHLATIDIDAPTSGNKQSLFTDGVHPTDQGYVVVAKAMYDGLMNASAGMGGAGGGRGAAGGISGGGGAAATGGRAPGSGGGGGGGRAMSGGAGGGATAGHAGGVGGTGGGGSGGTAQGSGGSNGSGSGGGGSGGAAMTGSSGGTTMIGGSGGTESSSTGGAGNHTSGSGGTSGVTSGSGGTHGSGSTSSSGGCEMVAGGLLEAEAPGVALLLIGVAGLGRRRRRGSREPVTTFGSRETCRSW